MDFNVSLIKKISNILEMSSSFDKISVEILQGDVKLNPKTVEKIKELTSLYMLIRAEHGALIVLNDKLKNDIASKSSTLSDKLISKLYDLSTFTSIIENVNNLVSNTDFEFKKIALMYPRLISSNTTHIFLFVKTIDQTDKYIKMIEEVKKLRPEHEYHVIECEKVGKKIDCSPMIKSKLSIEVKSLPSMYIISESNVTEVPIEKISVSGDLIKMLD
jgi:hypothetical protein